MSQKGPITKALHPQMPLLKRRIPWLPFAFPPAGVVSAPPASAIDCGTQKEDAGNQ